MLNYIRAHFEITKFAHELLLARLGPFAVVVIQFSRIVYPKNFGLRLMSHEKVNLIKF